MIFILVGSMIRNSNRLRAALGVLRGHSVAYRLRIHNGTLVFKGNVRGHVTECHLSNTPPMAYEYL